MNKLLGLLVTIVISACGSPAPEAMTDDGWWHYKSSFMQPGGAVSDTGNQGVSHSEGQGYAMLLAEAYGDRASFNRLWLWTRQHLQIRDDHLFAWRWTADKGVEDENNATDGDLLIAWALYRAGKRWSDVEYSEAALYIVRDIRDKLVHQVGQYHILLPGEHGFEKDGYWQINLSYWVYPALQELAILDRSSIWSSLISSGKTLTRTSRQGQWNLPPDWVDLTNKGVLKPAQDRPPRFGYEAVRVPLYLIWAGDFDEHIIRDSARFWSTTAKSRFTPAWVNVENNTQAEYEAPAGFKAVHSLSRLALNSKRRHPPQDLMIKNLKEQDYYSSSLILLSRLAYYERLKR